MRTAGWIGFLAICLLAAPIASQAAETERPLRLLTAHKAGTDDPQIELESWTCVVGAYGGQVLGKFKSLPSAPTNGELDPRVTIRDVHGTKVELSSEGVPAPFGLQRVERFVLNVGIDGDAGLVPDSCEIDFGWLPNGPERGGLLRWIEKPQ